MNHAYWGTSFNNDQIFNCLKKNEKNIEDQKCSTLHKSETLSSNKGLAGY